MRNTIPSEPATEQNTAHNSMDNKPPNMPSTTTQKNSNTKTALDISQSTEIRTEPEFHSLLSGVFSSRSYSGDGENEEAGAKERIACSQHSARRGYCTCIPLRFVVMGLVFVGMVIISAMRTNIGVTVLTILDRDKRPVSSSNATSLVGKVPPVDWDTLHVGVLHSAFYLGYMLSHPPAGYLTTRIPSHKLLAVCILLSCLLNLCLPVAIQLGGYATTLTIRFLQGLSEGLLYPACYAILRHWSTPRERGRVGALVFTGAHLGPVLGFSISGVITDYLGWQYVYYFNGSMGVVFVLVWAWLSEEKPAHHKLISRDELNFIEDLQGSEKVEYEGAAIPWAQMVTSLPVLSLCLCHFARNWVYVLCLTNEPFYISIFPVSITKNGLYSALPHVLKISAALVSGLMADWFLSNGLMTTAATRKLLTTCFGVQALFFYLLTRTETSSTAMPFLILAIGFGGFSVSGWQLNHYELSARHASVLVAIRCTFRNLASVSSPVVIGIMTAGKTFEGWNHVFCITAGILAFSWLCFLVFGSGERQSWAAHTDRNPLVVKEGRGRHSPNWLSGATTAPTFSFTCEAAGGHVTSSHMSQQTTWYYQRSMEDRNG